VGKPEGKRPLGRPEHRLLDNAKMDLTRDGMGWYELDLSGSGPEPVKGSCEHGNEPSGSINWFNSCTIGDFSRWAQLHVVD
jgi:hypothetical protein